MSAPKRGNGAGWAVILAGLVLCVLAALVAVGMAVQQR